MQRRDFLKTSGAALSSLAAGAPAGMVGVSMPSPAEAAVDIEIALSIERHQVEQIDGEVVFMWAFAQKGIPQVPGAPIRVQEGQRIVVTVTNNSRERHGFEIAGIPASRIVGIPAGATKSTSEFRAPVGGTYMYLDPMNAPANRVLGLHGAFIVTPAEGRTTSGRQTPYSRRRLTPAVARLFNAFGPQNGRFPGERWRPARDLAWVINQIDPRFNAMAERGNDIDARTMAETFLGRYFTVNGVSGFEAAHDPTIIPRGFVGQPMLLRTLNAGLHWHALHIHGNHVFEIAGVTGSPSDRISTPGEGPGPTGSGPDGSVVLRRNLVHRDVWTLAPTDRKDLLLPYERPPDIPDESRFPQAYPPADETVGTKAPLRYVIHCHTEMSTTAAGGNYPQGLMAHWEIFPRELIGQVSIEG